MDDVDFPEIRTYSNFNTVIPIVKEEIESKMETISFFQEFQTNQLPIGTTVKSEQIDGNNRNPCSTSENFTKCDVVLDSDDNVNRTTTSGNIFENLQKSETQSISCVENELCSDSDNSNPDPEHDPFADIKCDPIFLRNDLQQSHCTSSVATTQQQVQDRIEKGIDLGHRLISASASSLKDKPTSSKTETSHPPTIVYVTLKQENKPRIKKFECTLCLTKLSTANELKSHVSICSKSHKDRHLFCVICNKKYSRASNLKIHHLRVHSGGIEGMRPDFYRTLFQCQFCPMAFVLRESFKIHTESHVRKLERDPAQNKANVQLQLKPSYKCQECGSSFGSGMDLSCHVEEKHGVKIFKCPQPNCEKVFITKDRLRQHHNLHIDYKQFKCPESNCGKTFKRLANLRVHMPRHSLSHSEPGSGVTSKPFKCEECGKAFSKNWMVNSHVKEVHPTGEPVKCPHSDCGKTFKQPRSLKTHLDQQHTR